MIPDANDPTDRPSILASRTSAPPVTIAPKRRSQDYIVHDHAVEDESADVDVDLALILHRDRMRAIVLGEDRSGTFIITDVWRRGNDGWNVWRRHSTPLGAGRLPRVSSAEQAAL